MASNINIQQFDTYVLEQFLSSNNERLLSNTFPDLLIYSSNYQIDHTTATMGIYDILEVNYTNTSISVYDLYYYSNLSNNSAMCNEVYTNSNIPRYSIDDEGLLVYSDTIYDLSSNATGRHYQYDSNMSENDSYYDYKIRYDYFKDLVKFIEDKNFKEIDTNNKQFLLTDYPSTSDKLKAINDNIKFIFQSIRDNSTDKTDKVLTRDTKVFIYSLKYYYYIALLVITHYIITNFNSIQNTDKLLDEFKTKILTITNDISNFNVDNTDTIKNNIVFNDDEYKKNNDAYSIKSNELKNIVNSNVYTNIFLYITIVILIIICLGVIYINNHKGSLKTQYSIAVITFLLLYYIVYTNVVIDIENFGNPSENKDTLEGLIRKVIAYLEIIKNDKPYIKSLLEKEKDKYANYAKSSKSKVNNLELVLNDEFINAIKSKELVKFLILFTAICIVCFIVQTNVEDLTTTSIIFIILFIIILSIYFYNINLMTRTKHDNKYWNHRMTMK